MDVKKTDFVALCEKKNTGQTTAVSGSQSISVLVMHAEKESVCTISSSLICPSRNTVWWKCTTKDSNSKSFLSWPERFTKSIQAWWKGRSLSILKYCYTNKTYKHDWHYSLLTLAPACDWPIPQEAFSLKAEPLKLRYSLFPKAMFWVLSSKLLKQW